MKNCISKSLKSNFQARASRDYPWKLLDHLVDDLQLSLSESDRSKVKGVIRSRSVERYLQLAEEWGPQSIHPLGTSADVFRAKYQVAALLKKFRFPSDDSARRETALTKFRQGEDLCREFNTRGLAALRSLDTDTDESKALNHAKAFVRRLLGATLPSEDILTHWSRHGPGASRDTKHGNTSKYDKYSGWPYSCTSHAIPYARRAIQRDQRWHTALLKSWVEKNSIDLGSEDISVLAERFWTDVLRVEQANRITFVPKNSQTDRSIAIECTMNLYLQLGVDGFIRRRLKRWGVDLDSQFKNQRLSYEGSRNWESDDPFVTLDMSMASDTVSIGVCSYLLPPSWFHYLMDLRAPIGELGDDIIYYEKISSMGNGYTFALESLIFTALVYGCMRVAHGSFDRDAFAVFGDDIVIRRSAYPLLANTLAMCGFKINTEKSFVSGPFRESCGTDWFGGTSVRPVFLDTYPTSAVDLVCDLNRLRRWYYGYCGMWESSSCAFLYGLIPSVYKRFTGPPSDTEFDTYIHVPYPTKRQRGWVWKFDSIYISLRESNRGTNFDFRKLMSELRPHNEAIPTSIWASKSRWWNRLVAEQNVFAVPNKRSVQIGVSHRTTSYWPDGYSEWAANTGPV